MSMKHHCYIFMTHQSEGTHGPTYQSKQASFEQINEAVIIKLIDGGNFMFYCHGGMIQMGFGTTALWNNNKAKREQSLR